MAGKQPKTRVTKAGRRPMNLRFLLGIPTLTLALLLLIPILALCLGTSLNTVYEAFVDPSVRSAITRTVCLAGVAVGLGTLLGVPTGYLLARTNTVGTRLLGVLVELPLVIPHPIVGISLLMLFSPHTLIGAALGNTFNIQVAAASPGIVLAMMVVSAPYIIKSARDGFLNVPIRYHNMARSLGASPLQTFLRVELPLARRQIRSGMIQSWARAVSEFGSIAILAYYPQTAPVLIWDRFSTGGLQNALGPAVLLLAVCLSIFLLLEWLDASLVRREDNER